MGDLLKVSPGGSGYMNDNRELLIRGFGIITYRPFSIFVTMLPTNKVAKVLKVGI
jgi:hypothetical protein